MQFAVWRGLLGFSEAMNFPACTKAASEWFSKSERALATGIFNAGPNVASVVGPPLFVALTEQRGWRTCFIAVSAAGLVWLLFWVWLYRTPVAAERESKPAPVASTVLLQHRATWGYVLGKALVDPAWFFLLYWLPLYFRDVQKLDMTQIGWALPVIYFSSGVGSVSAGWISSRFLRMGWTTRRARMAVIMTCAVIVPVAIGAAIGGTTQRTIAFFSLAAAAHQAFSSMAFTIAGDVFPGHVLGTVLGWGGFAGSISSVIFSALIPGLLVPLLGYTPLLIALSLGYLATAILTRFTFGDFEPVAV